MNMSRYIVRRIVVISTLILFAGLWLALWRAQFDVKREERGAADEVRLFENLYALENVPAAGIDANLTTLREINSSGNLRHVRFTLSDGDGRVLVAPSAEEPLTLLQRAFAATTPGIPSPALDPSGPWLLQRDDGRRFLCVVVESGQRAAGSLDNLVGMLLVLLGYAAVVLAVFWTLRRALAPMGRCSRDRPLSSATISPIGAALPFREADAIGRALNHMAGTLATAQEQRRALSLKLVSSRKTNACACRANCTMNSASA
jgi:hypothetical protein